MAILISSILLFRRLQIRAMLPPLTHKQIAMAEHVLHYNNSLGPRFMYPKETVTYVTYAEEQAITESARVDL